MPVSLTTGTPGAGKSLWTIAHVEALRKETGREVYYSGIKGLTLPWHEFGKPGPAGEEHLTDATDWHQCPTGAIIVIDEAQRVFRPRGAGTKVPDTIAAFETHRHRGHDIFLVTQNPGLIDSNIRKLTETHRHLMRKFGATLSTVHRWQGVRDNCDKSRKDSIPTQWRFPKEAYGWYKSSEVHTVKFRLPGKLWLALCLPLVIGVLAWYVFWGRAMLRGDTVPARVTGGGSVPAGAAPTLPGAVKAWDVKDFVPRLEGLPHTAPRYDELTKPVRVPTLVGCIVGTGKSYCITQQGTKVYPPKEVIANIMEHGMFVDWDRGPEPGQIDTAHGQGANTAQYAPAGRPAALGDGAQPVARQAVVEVPPLPRPQGITQADVIAALQGS
jgi:hypothetical protein